MAHLLNPFRFGRGTIGAVGAVAAGLAWLWSWSPVRAQGAVLHAPEPASVEYGFLNNSDMDKAGSVSVELDSVGIFGRRGRNFASADTQLSLAYALTDHFQVTIGPQFTLAAMHVVPGLPDGARAFIGGVGGDLRLRLVDRRTNPVGVTLQLTPQVRFADEAVRGGIAYGLAVNLAIDRELLANSLFGTLNLTYELNQAHVDGIPGWDRGTRLGLGLGLATRVTPTLHVGAEFRYLRRHDGFGIGRFQGQALYLGPTVYAEFGRSWWASLSWQAQISGHEAGNPRGMDLIGFERHQVRLRLGYEF